MGSKGVALLLSLNLLFFSMISSSSGYKPPPPPPPTNSSSPLPPTPSRTPPPPPPPNSISPPPPPPPVVSPPPRCPNLFICLNILFPSSSCCTLLRGLTDLEAAVCLCAQIRAQVIGIPISINILLDLVLNRCGKRRPPNYFCN